MTILYIPHSKHFGCTKRSCGGQSVFRSNTLMNLKYEKAAFMVLIIKNNSENPYKNLCEYKEISTVKNVGYNGQIYDKEMTYVKKLTTIHRIALGVMAFIACLTILPYYFLSDKVTIWWQQAKSGTDEKIVLIKDCPPKQVQFGAVRGRLFDKEKPTIDVQDQTSIVFEQIENQEAHTIADLK